MSARRRRLVRPFCKTCGADLASRTKGCIDPDGCAKPRASLTADPHPDPFERKHDWSDRDAVFDAFIAAGLKGDEAHIEIFAETCKPQFDGHQRISAVSYSSSAKAKVDPYVIIYGFHDEDFEPDKETVSQREMRDASHDIVVNSPAQARAIVRALRASFGEDAIS